MIRFTTQKCLITAMLLALMAMQSCIKDNGETEPPTDGATITLTMRLPGNSVATRALDEDDEIKVGTIEVLVFDYASQEYRYTAYGNQVSQSSNEVTFTVRLLEGGPVDLVVLSNSRKWIGRSYGGEIPKDVTLLKTDIQKKLAADVSMGWVTDKSDSGYNPIPMWGEARNITVDENLSIRGSIDKIGMTRMLARIDVSLMPGAQDNFKLKSVRLYNYNTRGLIIPDTENTDIWDDGKAKDASLPVNPGRMPEPLVYNTMTTTDIACAGEIYTFEAAAGSVSKYSENICLVIGGEYHDTERDTWTTYYYRADFANIESYTSTYIPVKRNHQYKIQVKRITGPGYTKPEDAFKSMPSNIEAGVLHWNESDMDEMWFDGTYYYSVSPLDIESWASATTGNQIKVKTDYPTWSYELSDLPIPGSEAANPANVDWLKITSIHVPGEKYPGNGQTQFLEYSVAKNGTTEKRTAYIHVTAGRVIMTVKILQTLWIIEKVSLEPPGELKIEGETREVVVEGVFADIDVRAVDITHGDLLIDEATVSSNSELQGYPSVSASLDIPGVWHPTDRTQKYDRVVAFQYYSTEHADWRLIRTEDQPSYWLNIRTNHVDGQDIKGPGALFNVEVFGRFPAIALRAAIRELNGEFTAIAKSGGSIPERTDDSSSPVTGTLYVPAASPTATRDVYLQYSIDNVQWTTISSGTQQRGNALFVIDNREVYISYDFYKENGNMVKFSWAEAAGIPTDYNNQLFNRSSANNTVIYPSDEVNPATGCGAYYEGEADDPLTGIGKWRLATYNEMDIMRKNRDIVGNIDTNLLLMTWSTREVVGVGATYWELGAGGTSEAVKANNYYVRCVRTAPEQ